MQMEFVHRRGVPKIKTNGGYEAYRKMNFRSAARSENCGSDVLASPLSEPDMDPTSMKRVHQEKRMNGGD